MPSYVYEDPETKQRVERVFSIFADLPASFVVDGRTYRRVFEAPPVIYGTGGFYTTDNANSIDKWRRENLKGE